jgi:hypothetical protein
MTGTDLCVNKSQFVPVIFEPPCNFGLDNLPGSLSGSIPLSCSATSE